MWPDTYSHTICTAMLGSTKKKANIATQSFPMTAEGTRSTFFAYLARLALTAYPKAVIKPTRFC